MEWVVKIGLDGGNIDIVGRFARVVKEIENFMLLINGSGNGGWRWDRERRWRLCRRWRWRLKRGPKGRMTGGGRRDDRGGSYRRK